MVLRSPVPVVLDCYADWCAPCKELTPVLESAVARAGGAAKLRFAVLNVDEEPELAEKLQVKSLPTVFGVFQGRLVGAPLVGNAAPADVAAFVAKLLEAAAATEAAAAAPLNPLAHAAALLEAGDAKAAAAVYKHTYTLLLAPPAARPPGAPKPTAAEAQVAAAEAKAARQQAASCLVGLATCAHVAGDAAARQELLLAVKQKHAAEVGADAGLAAAVANLELAAAAGGGPDGNGGGIAGLEAALAAAEADAAAVAAGSSESGAAGAAAARDVVLDAKGALARALFAAARFEDAVDQALGVLKAGGVAWRGGASRDLCVQFFDALGPGSALAQKGRRRMANLLFR
jgi:putative thioredoxin